MAFSSVNRLASLAVVPSNATFTTSMNNLPLHFGSFFRLINFNWVLPSVSFSPAPLPFDRGGIFHHLLLEAINFAH